MCRIGEGNHGLKPGQQLSSERLRAEPSSIAAGLPPRFSATMHGPTAP